MNWYFFRSLPSVLLPDVLEEILFRLKRHFEDIRRQETYYWYYVANIMQTFYKKTASFSTLRIGVLYALYTQSKERPHDGWFSYRSSAKFETSVDSKTLFCRLVGEWYYLAFIIASFELSMDE